MRPKDKIFDMAWRPENTTTEEIEQGKLLSEYRIQKQMC